MRIEYQFLEPGKLSGKIVDGVNFFLRQLDERRFRPLSTEELREALESLQIVIAIDRHRGDELMVGMGALSKVQTLEGLVGYLKHFAVHPDYRDRGVGNELLGKLLVRARADNIVQVVTILPPGAVEMRRLLQRRSFRGTGPSYLLSVM
ncbi:MAG: GNAT family N-acetyltransferase [Anaplasmataceae bacterium]|nr:GNAT family N-acetyltransferase [Anaplasmataceae bacterium]